MNTLGWKTGQPTRTQINTQMQSRDQQSVFMQTDFNVLLTPSAQWAVSQHIKHGSLHLPSRIKWCVSHKGRLAGGSIIHQKCRRLSLFKLFGQEIRYRIVHGALVWYSLQLMTSQATHAFKESRNLNCFFFQMTLLTNL